MISLLFVSFWQTTWYFTFLFVHLETGKIEEATKKCLELKIRCLTIAGYIQLPKNCAAGALTAQFQPVQDKLRGITENPQLEMEVVIYEENALSTFQQIGCYIFPISSKHFQHLFIGANFQFNSYVR